MKIPSYDDMIFKCDLTPRSDLNVLHGAQLMYAAFKNVIEAQKYIDPHKCRSCVNIACRVIPVSSKCDYDPRYVLHNEENKNV